jgi:NAD(P)-dependent dehydrogenase (short-subunit alcohol dehydrogenase family)
MGEAPAGRLATPEDVAWAVGILLDDAAAMMDGSTLFLDGGRRTSLP